MWLVRSSAGLAVAISIACMLIGAGARAGIDEPQPGEAADGGLADSLSGNAPAVDIWMQTDLDSLPPVPEPSDDWLRGGRDTAIPELTLPEPEPGPEAVTEDHSEHVTYTASDSDGLPPEPLKDDLTMVVRYGAGGSILPSHTPYKRYPTIGLSACTSRPGPAFYFHTGLSALELRETERVEHLLWMVDLGFAMAWAEGRGFIGVGASIQTAGSMFAKDEDEEREEEDEDDGGWSLIRDVKEFAVLPQAYLRVPLGASPLGIEVSYVWIRENKPLSGGVDVKLMFNLSE